MQINDAIRLTIETCELKHLSLSTQKSYTHWLRRYGLFLKDRKPATTELKIEAFLTHLATTHIAASTQNQAFNALLFFYREVLKPPCVISIPKPAAWPVRSANLYRLPVQVSCGCRQERERRTCTRAGQKCSFCPGLICPNTFKPSESPVRNCYKAICGMDKMSNRAPCWLLCANIHLTKRAGFRS
jgi:hypothetical protein